MSTFEQKLRYVRDNPKEQVSQQFMSALKQGKYDNQASNEGLDIKSLKTPSVQYDYGNEELQNAPNPNNIAKTKAKTYNDDFHPRFGVGLEYKGKDDPYAMTKMVVNAPSSLVGNAWDIVKGGYGLVRHPIKTTGTMLGIIKGIDHKDKGFDSKYTKMVDVIWDELKKPYSSEEAFREAMVEDLFRVAADAMTLIGGAGLVAKGLGKIGKLSKLTNIGKTLTKTATRSPDIAMLELTTKGTIGSIKALGRGKTVINEYLINLLSGYSPEVQRFMKNDNEKFFELLSDRDNSWAKERSKIEKTLDEAGFNEKDKDIIMQTMQEEIDFTKKKLGEEEISYRDVVEDKLSTQLYGQERKKGIDFNNEYDRLANINENIKLEGKDVIDIFKEKLEKYGIDYGEAFEKNKIISKKKSTTDIFKEKIEKYGIDYGEAFEKKTIIPKKKSLGETIKEGKSSLIEEAQIIQKVKGIIDHFVNDPKDPLNVNTANNLKIVLENVIEQEKLSKKSPISALISEVAYGIKELVEDNSDDLRTLNEKYMVDLRDINKLRNQFLDTSISKGKKFVNLKDDIGSVISKLMNGSQESKVKLDRLKGFLGDEGIGLEGNFKKLQGSIDNGKLLENLDLMKTGKVKNDLDVLDSIIGGNFKKNFIKSLKITDDLEFKKYINDPEKYISKISEALLEDKNTDLFNKLKDFMGDEGVDLEKKLRGMEAISAVKTKGLTGFAGILTVFAALKGSAAAVGLIIATNPQISPKLLGRYGKFAGLSKKTVSIISNKIKTGAKLNTDEGVILLRMISDISNEIDVEGKNEEELLNTAKKYTQGGALILNEMLQGGGGDNSFLQNDYGL